MTQHYLILKKDTSLSTSQTVPFLVFDSTMLTSKITKVSQEMAVQSVYLTMKMLRWKGQLVVPLLLECCVTCLMTISMRMKISVTITKIVTNLRNVFAVIILTINLKDTFGKVRIPFKKQPLINLVVKIVFESFRTGYVNGERQSIQFFDEYSVSLFDNIKLNKLPFFSQRIELKPSGAERTVTLLKADCRFFANFYVACQSRAGDPENFFAHENHALPVSLSEYEKLHNCVKSDFIDCLQNLREPSLDPPDVQTIIVDGAAMVHPSAARQTYDAHHYVCVLNTTIVTQRNSLGFLINCEVSFIFYFCDESLCCYIFMQI